MLLDIRREWMPPFIIPSENIIGVTQWIQAYGFSSILIFYFKSWYDIKIDFKSEEKAIEVLEKIKKLISIDPPIIIF